VILEIFLKKMTIDLKTGRKYHGFRETVLLREADS